MEFEGHPDGWGHHLLQQVHVGEHPLVPGGDPEVALEEGVEAVQEGVQAARQGFSGNVRQSCVRVKSEGEAELRLRWAAVQG